MTQNHNSLRTNSKTELIDFILAFSCKTSDHSEFNIIKFGDIVIPTAIRIADSATNINSQNIIPNDLEKLFYRHGRGRIANIVSGCAPHLIFIDNRR